MTLKVYYLDDEPYLCEIFQELFSNDEIEVQSFSQVEAFIEATNKRRPDLVFLDYRLNKVTCDEVVNCLDPNLPKVLISGELHLEDITKFQKVLNKPYEIRVIKEYLQEFVRGKRYSPA